MQQLAILFLSLLVYSGCLTSSRATSEARALLRHKIRYATLTEEDVQAYLASGHSIEEQAIGMWGNRIGTLLHAASSPGNTNAVHILLDAGANPSSKAPGMDNAQPIHRAARANRPDVIKMLVEAGADVNARDALRRTPLHYASQVLSNDAAKRLIALGANPNLRATKFGFTPLSRVGGPGPVRRDGRDIDAAVLDMYRILLEGGADPNLADRDGYAPLNYVTRTEQLPVMRLLIGHGADPLHRVRGLLHGFVRRYGLQEGWLPPEMIDEAIVPETPEAFKAYLVDELLASNKANEAMLILDLHSKILPEEERDTLRALIREQLDRPGALEQDLRPTESERQ